MMSNHRRFRLLAAVDGGGGGRNEGLARQAGLRWPSRLGLPADCWKSTQGARAAADIDGANIGFMPDFAMVTLVSTALVMTPALKAVSSWPFPQTRRTF